MSKYARCALIPFAAALIACGSSEAPAAPASEITPTPPVAAAPREPAPAAPTPSVLVPLPEPIFDMRKATLGRRLFHDTRLSGDQTISCATCHSLDHGGAEPRRTSTGIGEQIGPINAPTVLNSGHNFVQFWDGRAADLEAQALGPVANPIEMGATWDEVVQRVASDAEYQSEFTALYPDQRVTQATITAAIAEYERSLATPSRFDAFLGGDQDALNEEERRGHQLFTTIGCTSCHRQAGIGGTMFQKMGLERDYFGEIGRPLTDADMGRYNVTHNEADRHFFKVPMLRNVALTAPYLHDGSQETLDAVVRIMGRYQLGRELDDNQVRALVAFLGSLTGELPAHARMPSGGGSSAGAAPTTGRSSGARTP